MELTTKTKVIISIVVVATAYAAGRYGTPTKVVTETKIVEVEKKKEDTKTDEKKNVQTTIIEVVKPDGSKQTTTTIVDATQTQIDAKEQVLDSKTTDTIKTVENSKSVLSIAVLAGANVFSAKPMVYGLHVQKPIIGPVNMGVWGLSDGTVGASLGLTF